MKITYKKFSSWTGEDIAGLEAEIRTVRAKYNELYASYTGSVALGSGHARWAKKK